MMRAARRPVTEAVVLRVSFVGHCAFNISSRPERVDPVA
jgi:hypothetical protein